MLTQRALGKKRSHSAIVSSHGAFRCSERTAHGAVQLSRHLKSKKLGHRQSARFSRKKCMTKQKEVGYPQCPWLGNYLFEPDVLLYISRIL